MNRDQYVQKLKSDLDRWNAQIEAWEETLREAHGDLRAKLQLHLDAWRDQRSLAAHKLREVQLASGEALADIVRGADEAWRDLAHAYELARQRFEEHHPAGDRGSAANDQAAPRERKAGRR